MVTHRSTPKMTILALKDVDGLCVKIDLAVRPERRIERKGKDRTVKKSYKMHNILPIWGEAPTVPIETKICMADHLADVITCAKFQDDIFKGYNFTGAGLNFPFSY